VGIGTSSPSTKLHIDGGTSAGLTLAGTSDSFINFGDADPNVGQIYYDHSGNFMSFRTNDNNQMRIDASGNVGIGTASPASKFHVQSGALQVSGNSIDTVISYSNVGIVGTATNHDLAFISNNSEKMRIDASGNVGIGASPTQRFSVVSDGGLTRANIINTANAAAGSGIQFAVQSGGSQVSNATLRVDNVGNFSVFTGTTNETERMRIDASGNVGIGTSTAAGSNGKGLAIYTSDYPRLTFRNSTTGDGTTDGTQFVASGLDFEMYNKEAGALILGTSNAERMRIDSSGNVGIGTTPDTKLDVNGVINVRTNGFSFGRITTNNTTGTDGGLTFQTISGGTFAERMRIASGGEVLVGTTSVFNAKLSVQSPAAFATSNFRSDSVTAAGTRLDTLLRYVKYKYCCKYSNIWKW
jgi:hypothetical protein